MSAAVVVPSCCATAHSVSPAATVYVFEDAEATDDAEDADDDTDGDDDATGAAIAAGAAAAVGAPAFTGTLMDCPTLSTLASSSEFSATSVAESTPAPLAISDSVSPAWTTCVVAPGESAKARVVMGVASRLATVAATTSPRTRRPRVGHGCL